MISVVHNCIMCFTAIVLTANMFHPCICTEASTTDVCMGLMRDAVKTMQSISHNLKMAEDSQWEQLNQYITQYLSIYLKSDSKSKLTMTDDISTTRSVVRTLCRFVSMLIECKETSSSNINTVFSVVLRAVHL